MIIQIYKHGLNLRIKNSKRTQPLRSFMEQFLLTEFDMLLNIAPYQTNNVFDALKNN